MKDFVFPAPLYPLLPFVCSSAGMLALCPSSSSTPAGYTSKESQNVEGIIACNQS